MANRQHHEHASASEPIHVRGCHRCNSTLVTKVSVQFRLPPDFATSLSIHSGCDVVKQKAQDRSGTLGCPHIKQTGSCNKVPPLIPTFHIDRRVRMSSDTGSRSVLSFTKKAPVHECMQNWSPKKTGFSLTHIGGLGLWFRSSRSTTCAHPGRDTIQCTKTIRPASVSIKLKSPLAPGTVLETASTLSIISLRPVNIRD